VTAADSAIAWRETSGAAETQKFQVGSRVSVPVRFGERGEVKEIKDGRYGVEFSNLSVLLW